MWETDKVRQNSYFKLLLLKVFLQVAESWVELVFTGLYRVFFTVDALLVDTNIETKLHWILCFYPVIIVEFTPFYPAT